jgi:pimeloyl-ACP methyl ester carboxylesterase
MFGIFLLLLLGLGWLAVRFGPAPLAHPGLHAVNELRQVELGGRRQWISIRGSNARNPVLLFLHGGPGSANLAKLRIQCPDLEEHFVVVTWDQRGAGKTFTLRLSEEHLTIGQLLSDTHQLAHYLRNRFSGKIYLLGFSWGTVLGLRTALDHPEDIQAYIAVGQIVDAAAGEWISLEYARKTARERGNQKAADELRAIDPLYRGPSAQAELAKERSWLLKFGGVYRHADSYGHEVRMLFQAPEYSLLDSTWWPVGSSLSLGTLWPEVMEVHFKESAPAVDVPAYFLAGRYDYNTPAELVWEYYQALVAPKGKQFVWFEDSAHDIFFDQPQELVKELVKIKEGGS